MKLHFFFLSQSLWLEVGIPLSTSPQSSVCTVSWDERSTMYTYAAGGVDTRGMELRGGGGWPWRLLSVSRDETSIMYTSCWGWGVIPLYGELLALLLVLSRRGLLREPVSSRGSRFRWSRFFWWFCQVNKHQSVHLTLAAEEIKLQVGRKRFPTFLSHCWWRYLRRILVFSVTITGEKKIKKSYNIVMLNKDIQW